MLHTPSACPATSSGRSPYPDPIPAHYNLPRLPDYLQCLYPPTSDAPRPKPALWTLLNKLLSACLHFLPFASLKVLFSTLLRFPLLSVILSLVPGLLLNKVSTRTRRQPLSDSSPHSQQHKLSLAMPPDYSATRAPYACASTNSQ